MAQTWNIPATGTTSQRTAVKTNIPDALEALRTCHSGATAPASTVAYMLWADTTSGFLKIRNAANNAWIQLAPLASERVEKVESDQTASLSATATMRLGSIGRAGTVRRLVMVCDTASTSSSGNEWQVMLRKRTNAAPGSTTNLFSGTVGTFTALSGVHTPATEFVAYQVLAFTPDQNATLAADDVLELVMTKTGSATTLVNFRAWAEIA